MPTKEFGIISRDTEIKLDTSHFDQKPYLRFYYIESNIEPDLDLENQCEIKKQPISSSSQGAAAKVSVDNRCNDLSIIKKLGTC